MASVEKISQDNIYNIIRHNERLNQNYSNKDVDISKKNLDYSLIQRDISAYDYYKERFDRDPEYKDVQNIAKIITWNIWQMDGLLDTVPLGKPFVNAEQISLFDNENENSKEISIPCKIKNWKTKKIITFKECKEIR